MLNAVRRAAVAARTASAPHARGTARRGIRALLVTVAVAGFAAVTAGPAAAQPSALAAGDTLSGGGSSDAAYYRSMVREIQPSVSGLDVKVSADGKVTLTNNSGRQVVVLGYAGEDYLRIGPNGAEENTASLTSGINVNPGSGQLPQSAATGTAQQPATWVKRSDQPTASWQDYRVLWTNRERPPIVTDSPHSEHKVFSWAVQLRVDNQQVLVLGDVIWTGAPWLSTGQTAILVVVIALLALAIAVVVMRRRRRGRRGRGHGRSVSAQPRTPVPSGWAG